MTALQGESRSLPGAAISDQACELTPTVQAQAHADESAESFFVNCHAVLVQGQTVRRRLYFSLHSAERAIERARARGDRADMVLVQLVPVQRIPMRGGRDD